MLPEIRLKIRHLHTCGVTCCTLFEKDSCDAKYLEMIAQWEKDNRGAGAGQNQKRDEKTADYVKSDLCDLCNFFGSTMYASRLFINDAMSTEKHPPRTCIRDGVGIDRDTGAAVEGAKFDYEVIETGALFAFRMTAENIQNTDRRLISLILKLLKSGLYVGGKRTGGLGKIILQNYNVTGFEDPDSLWKTLINDADESVEKSLVWEEMV